MASNAATSCRGDAIVVSRATGTVYSVDMATGSIRALLAGPDNRIGKSGTRGTGTALNSAGATSLLAWHDGRVLCHYGRSQTDSGLAWLDPFTGIRTPALGGTGAAFDSTGDMIALDDRFVLMAIDDYNDLDNGITSIYKYDTVGGTVTTVSGPSPVNGPVKGNGPIIRRGRGIGLLNPTTLVVAESGFNPPPGGTNVFGVNYQGCGVFLVDLSTGDRTFVSRLWRDGFARPTYVNGANSGNESLGFLSGGTNRGGTGPVVNSQVRTLTVVDGQIYVGTGLNIVAGFPGALLKIDPATGDRTLIFGQAFVDNGKWDTLTASVLTPGWLVNPVDAPVGMTVFDGGKIAFTNQFAGSNAPNRVLVWNTGTATLTTPAKTIASQVTSADLTLSGLTMYMPDDCNGDGLADSCQIGKGLTSDRNGDAVPDECQRICAADYDLDGFVTFTDFDAFVDDFEAGRTTADVSGDSFLDFGDFDVFVGSFESGC